MKHWIENIAEELSKRDTDKHVIASGTSISGSIHIGNSCDVFIANAIGKNCVNWEKKLKLFGLLMTMTHLEKFHTHYLKITINILECLTQQFHVLTAVVITL